MRALLLLLLCSSAIQVFAQRSGFPKNYVGAFYTSGYYTDYIEVLGQTTYGGIDLHSVGINLARRLTKNIYVQSHAFPAGGGYFFIDAGIKLNALVYHKLQPTGGLSLGSRLGYNDASNLYYSFGLDWHCFDKVVVQANIFSDYTVNTQGLRIGAMYKF